MDMQTVRLKKPHKHGGIDYAVGAVLRVKRHTAVWMVDQGDAEFVGAAAEQSPVLLSQPISQRRRKVGCCFR